MTVAMGHVAEVLLNLPIEEWKPGAVVIHMNPSSSLESSY